MSPPRRIALGGLVLAALVRPALAARAPSPAARLTHPAHHRTAPPPSGSSTVVRVAIEAGDRQSAHAFAASTGPGYETAYPQALVVRVSSPRARGGKPTVRFTCVQHACRFALAEQGDDVSRVDQRSYDVRVVDGRATLPLTLSTDSVPGDFTVRARALVRPGERSAGDAVFHLAVR
ncbi:MAG: hypothetical protein NVS3B17_02540 [Vulcanimicrobiaceae bacterium]